MIRRMTASLAAVLFVAALAGCGSGSSGSEDETPLAAIQASGVLRVGTEGTYSPFTFHESGSNELTGYDVDVIRAVAEKLGVEAEFSETPFDAIFAGLTSERWDVVANQVTRTPEREELYDLSGTYTVSEGVVLVRAGDTSIGSVEDLRGKTTAQSSTSNWAQVAEDAGADVESVEGFVQAVTLVKQGRVDAIVNDNLAVLDYLQNSGDTSVEVATQTGDRSEQVFAFRKDSGLVGPVDDALDELRADGTLAEISERYFGQDVSQ